MSRLICISLSILFVASRARSQCEDHLVRLPAPTSSIANQNRGIALYMAKGLVDEKTFPISWRGDDLLIPCIALDAETAESLRRVDELDWRTLREVFQTRHLATRRRRDQSGLIPETKVALERLYNFRLWERKIVSKSAVKQKTRVIYRSPTSSRPKISISETLDSEAGDLNAPLIETEVAVERSKAEDGSVRDWDFYAYNKEGELSPYSTFPSGQKPAPLVCLSCHYDQRTETMSKLLHH